MRKDLQLMGARYVRTQYVLRHRQGRAPGSKCVRTKACRVACRLSGTTTRITWVSSTSAGPRHSSKSVW